MLFAILRACLRRKSNLSAALAAGITIGISLLASGTALAQDERQGLLESSPLQFFGDAGALPLFSTLHPTTGIQTDVIFGQNTKGPYRLTWRGMLPSSVRVVRNGRSLTRDSDYILDTEKGTLTFATPLRKDQAAQVTYRCDTYAVEKNKTPQATPIQWNIWEDGSNQLTLRSQLQSGVGGSATPTPIPILQYLCQFKTGKKNNLNTALLFDLRGGNVLDRGGILLSDTAKLDFGEVGVTYSRAGALFAQESPGLKAGRESYGANATLSLLRGVNVSSLFRQTNQLLPSGQSGRGETIRELNNSLTIAPSGSPVKVEAARNQTQTTTPNGTELEQTRSAIRAETPLLRNTQATLGFEAVTTATAAPNTESRPGTYAQTSSLNLRSALSRELLVSGSYQNSLGSAGVQDIAAFRVEVLPFTRIARIRLVTSWEDRFRADGAQRNREALLELADLPLWQTRLSGGFRAAGRDGNDRTVWLLDASARPFRYLEFSGGMRLRNSNLVRPDAPAAPTDTFRANVAVTPSSKLRVTGSFAQNPEISEGVVRPVQSKAVGLETQLGPARLRGQYGLEEEYLTERLLNTLELGLDWRFSPSSLLTASYQTRSLLGSEISGTQTYMLGFTQRVGSAFDLSLTGTMMLNSRNRVVNWTDAEIRADASLGVRF